MLNSQQKKLVDKVVSLTEELSSIRVEQSNFNVNLDEMVALVKRVKDDVGKLLCNASTKIQKIYQDKVDAVERKIQADLVDG